MERKGIIAIGPVLALISLSSLLASAASIMVGFAMVSGIVFNRRLRETPREVIMPRVVLFFILTMLVMAGVHYTVGPTGDHYTGMLWGAVAFSIITAALSAKSIMQDAKNAIIAIAVFTLAFIVVSELSVLATTLIT